ncbi:amidase [Euzebya pacifica]|uniref:amidase n=1 Tax=Euzebya pacifica TaxID=1608957 RepID=UPI0030FC5980
MTTAADLRAGYAAALTTPTAVAEAFLAARPTERPWQAFRSVDAEDVRAQARASTERLAAGTPAGPLEGVPVGVKDFVAVDGYRSHAGTRDLVAHGDVDALLVRRLRDAGAIIVGKLHCTELGLSPTGISGAQPTPVNPHSPTHLTGGSSSGTGAAVGAGLIPLGVGSDGGGSIRIPAALCGVFGIKPSWDLVPTDGEMSVGWWSVEHIGPLARCTEDLTTMLSVMADVPLAISEEPLRFGVDWSWWGRPDAEVDAACRAVVAELSAADISIPYVDLAMSAGYATALAEVVAGVWDVWQDTPDRFSTDVRATLGMSAHVTGADYVRAQQVRRVLAESFEAAFETVDVIVVPTTATAAPPRPSDAELDAGVVDLDMLDAMIAYTFPANLCGLPAASVPVGQTLDGRPIGLQLIGRRGADATVLSACAALERAGLAAAPVSSRQHDPFPVPTPTTHEE